MIITNPQNNYSESISYFGTFIWTLLFGALYFAYKGIWTHFVVGVILAVATYGLSWLIYPFFSYSILKKHYLKNGWMVH